MLEGTNQIDLFGSTGNYFSGFGVDLIVKIVLLAFLSLYLIFSLIMVKQVSVLTKVVETPHSNFLVKAAWYQFIITAAVAVFVLLI